MKVVNIKWDTNGDLKVLKNLPTEIDITNEFAQSDYVEDGEFDEERFFDDVSDWLSDTYGYCHKGFEIVNE